MLSGFLQLRAPSSDDLPEAKPRMTTAISQQNLIRSPKIIWREGREGRPAPHQAHEQSPLTASKRSSPEKSNSSAF